MHFCNWFISINLKDTYFCVPIFHQHRKLSLFLFQTGSILIQLFTTVHNSSIHSKLVHFQAMGHGKRIRPHGVSPVLVDRCLDLSMIKTFAAAISSCNKWFGENSVFIFSCGIFWKNSGDSNLCGTHYSPQWDQPLVLRAFWIVDWGLSGFCLRK